MVSRYDQLASISTFHHPANEFNANEQEKNPANNALYPLRCIRRNQHADAMTMFFGCKKKKKTNRQTKQNKTHFPDFSVQE